MGEAHRHVSSNRLATIQLTEFRFVCFRPNTNEQTFAISRHRVGSTNSKPNTNIKRLHGISPHVCFVLEKRFFVSRSKTLDEDDDFLTRNQPQALTLPQHPAFVQNVS